ncbi:toprim domain-containing protein [Paenibacillus graminis]|uniref:toprim domain-containing protein n=1 Tax=Paenibacillus graminis TaxID=189425 RepID=UPI002DBD2D1B|nr:toprim domain-containing protein [Paenibacillus graminis]MEC0167912.1 toprim domain-containing protein [Paenibacillus graminis]
MYAINHELLLDALERYPFRNPAYARGRLSASSPFGSRADNTPSFSVVVDPHDDAFGCWNDAGAVDPEWARGSPVKLFAFLHNITEFEAFTMLYSAEDENAPPSLRINLRAPAPPTARRPIDVTPYIAQEVPYLTGRGIAPIIQSLYRSGFDAAKNAVVMPWAGPSGRVLNAKWRSVSGKIFYYAKGGAPVKSMIYGIDIAYARRIKRAAIVEAEIDAMTAATAGTFGLAVGGSEFTEQKAELLRRSPIEELLIAGDNDEAGEKLRWQITRKLNGYMRLYNVEINGAKDFNAAGIEATREACARATPVFTVRPRLIVR